MKDCGQLGLTAFWQHAADEDDGHQHAKIWLTSDVAVNRIGARFLALTAGLEPAEIRKFDRVFNLFDGTSKTAVSAARDSWKRWSVKDYITCRYFAQNDWGRWRQKIGYGNIFPFRAYKK